MKNLVNWYKKKQPTSLKKKKQTNPACLLCVYSCATVRIAATTRGRHRFRRQCARARVCVYRITLPKFKPQAKISHKGCLKGKCNPTCSLTAGTGGHYDRSMHNNCVIKILMEVGKCLSCSIVDRSSTSGRNHVAPPAGATKLGGYFRTTLSLNQHVSSAGCRSKSLRHDAELPASALMAGRSAAPGSWHHHITPIFFSVASRATPATRGRGGISH